jgi:alpha-galactosidase
MAIFLRRVVLALTVFAAAAVSQGAPADEARAWLKRFDTTARVPFAFTYDGVASAELLPGWKVEHARRDLPAGKSERTVTYTDPKTGLQVRCVAVSYGDYPAVEWTVYLKNTGPADTPLLTGIQALNAAWSSPSAHPYTLRYNLGILYPPAAADFSPQTTKLYPVKNRTNPYNFRRFFPILGRPSGGILPYFNVNAENGGGVIVAVGWPGAWFAEYGRNEAGELLMTAGQEYTRLKLLPGEEIRTPLMALLFYRGDWLDGQNSWRRWMIDHNLPRPGGQPLQPRVAANSSAYFHEMVHADAASQLAFIDRYREENIPLDYWWMDAGWYEHRGRWQEPATSWRLDRKRFPQGLREVTDHGRKFGLKSVVWFEPERIMPSNELFQEHPDWLIRNPTPFLISRLLYLGNPVARDWLINQVSSLITSEGIDVYRQDFNIVEPLNIWRGNDAPDRQGITENHHVTGYLAVYDELLRRHPGLLIDNCAGGGSRNDLESMRRSVPFWRSDYAFDPASNQNQTLGLALWLPYQGTATHPDQWSRYDLRSHFATPLINLSWDVRDRTLPYDVFRQAVRDWRTAAENYFGDFYPLTPSTVVDEAWLAWQFHRPEAGRGVIQAFRREKADEPTLRVKLRGLDPAAQYRITDLDHPDAARTIAGQELMATGLTITLNDRPAAAIVTYAELQ